VSATAVIPIVISVPIMLIFSRLKVEVDRAELRWGFGSGSPRWSIPIAELKSAAVVRNPWFYGLGFTSRHRDGSTTSGDPWRSRSRAPTGSVSEYAPTTPMLFWPRSNGATRPTTSPLK
jgi:hypothetical protein